MLRKYKSYLSIMKSLLVEIVVEVIADAGNGEDEHGMLRYLA